LSSFYQKYVSHEHQFFKIMTMELYERIYTTLNDKIAVKNGPKQAKMHSVLYTNQTFSLNLITKKIIFTPK